MIKVVKHPKENLSVLIVEDDADDYEFLVEALKKCCETISIHWVQDGDQAVDYLFRNGEYKDELRYPTPDLVFLDIRIPKKSGLDVAKMIKQDLSLKKLLTVMVTTSSAYADVNCAYENGVNGYLKKPEGAQEMEEFQKAICNFWSPVFLFP